MDAPDFAAILAPRLPEWTGDSRLRWMNMAEQALAARRVARLLNADEKVQP